MRAPPYLPTILTGLVLAVLTALPAGAQSSPANQDRSVRVDRQSRQATVIVIDNETGETIRTFSLGRTFSVQAFLLDGGNTVAISQSIFTPPFSPPFDDVTVFLNIDTGEEIARLFQRIHGFSKDGSIFFAQTRLGTAIYEYPTLEQICPSMGNGAGVPGSFQFSPDRHFLLVTLLSWDPNRTNPPTVSMADTYFLALYDIEACQEVPGFSRLWNPADLAFSDDSQFLHLDEERICLRQFGIEGRCRFNLTTYEVETF